MSNIDPVEATLAVVGMDKVISDAVEKITSKDRKRIVKMDEEIKSRVETMIHGNGKPRFSLPPDYMTLLDSLTKPMNVAQIEKMINALPPEVQTGFMARSSNIYKFLQNEIPKNSVKTIAGVKQLTPNDPDYFKFHWVYSVICDPLSSIDLMSAGALFRSQSDAVRMFFPSLSESIDDAIDEAIPNAKADDESFEVPFETEIGLRVWRSMPVIQGNYQDVYFNANQERKISPDMSQAQLDHAAASTASPAEQAEFPKAV